MLLNGFRSVPGLDGWPVRDDLRRPFARECSVLLCLQIATAALLAGTTANADPDWEEGRLPAAVYAGVPRIGGTLAVRLDQEPPSLDKLTDSALAIDWMLERKVLESMAEPDASKHPEYPLKPALATSWTISPDHLTFTFRLRHDVVWHDGKPFSGKDVVATVRKILDPSVRAMHLRNNFVDLEEISTAPGDDFTVVARYRKPYFLAFRALATLSIYPAHLLETGGDMLHSAIHRAIDTEAVRKSFLLGLDRPTTCHFYLDSSACDRSLAPRSYDPARAAQLLDEAGWRDHDGDGVRDKDGVPFRFTFLMNADSVFLDKLTPYLQQELHKLGVEMEIRKVDWAHFVQLVEEHQFDATSLPWGNPDVVQDPYEIWHSSQIKDGSNYVLFKDPRADQLIEQARAVLDDARRNELYRKLGRLLYDEAPYTFLYSRPSLDPVSSRVRGIRPSVVWYDLEDVWLAPP